MRAIFFLCALLCVFPSCQKKKRAIGSAASERPSLLPAFVEQSSADPLWDHPWLRAQPHVTELDDVIRDDLDSIETICQALARQREQAGFPPVSKEEDKASILRQVEALQKPLQTLELSYPSRWYNVLNIPPTDRASYPTPVNFQVHKRVYVDRNGWGMPVFLDLRVFQLDRCPYEERAQEVIQWHCKLLKEPRAFFRCYEGKEWTILVGRGPYNTEHFDPSHGFSKESRGVFLAYRQEKDRLYVLFLDAPRETFDKHQSTLMSIVR